ncbi:cytochrome P450 [Actinomadura chibensis]|uniref:Cytochrome P450 n=1 Tax=Actinomadura chibensis TaxID=392828 RepID=A0A5D0NE36_9ACTN|nr:cytochrome P450 [Actinomadura chibensis]TYB42491.1 cytochrome P450 [Actinomadura chibensis]
MVPTVQTKPRADEAPPNRATVSDTLRIAGTVLVPAVARGVLARRPRVVALAEALRADRRAGRLLRRLRGRYGPGPLLLALPGRSFALVLSPRDVERLLTGSPEPFALATKEKRAALGHFQPHGVLVSRGAERADRRRFNEEVLGTGEPVHPHAGALVPKIREEAAGLAGAVALAGRLDWADFRMAWWRMARRVVLGDAARDDSEVSDLLTTLRMDANWAFAHPRRRRTRREFFRRLSRYLDDPEPGSLAGLMAGVPASEATEPADQVPQWLFAYESTALAAFRTLALLAAHPEHAERARREAEAGEADMPFLRACVLESLRLWPTTMTILRDSTRPTEWAGRTLPTGTGFLIHTPFLQRDEENLPYADFFEPGVWLDGTAERDRAVVPFSDGPGKCPGRHLALLSASHFLAVPLRDFDLRQDAGLRLSRDRPLPRTLSPFRLGFDARPR